jgi:flagellar motor switch protein FliG
MDDEEIGELSLAMANLGTMNSETIEEVFMKFTTEVMIRMLGIQAVRKEVRGSHEMIAEIFNNFDRGTEQRFLASLEERGQDSAEKIKALVFPFEDLVSLDSNGVQVLLRNVEKSASETLPDLFFSNMSARAGKVLREDMDAMGPVRLREVDEAQTAMVAAAKDLSDRGEDELVY